MSNIREQIEARRAQLSGGSDVRAQIAARRAQLSGVQSPVAQRIATAKAGTLQASPESLERAAAADQIVADRLAIEGAGGAAGGMMAKAAQGVPFVGEYVDEAFDAINPGQGQRVRDLQSAMDRQMPGRAMSAQIGGGVVGSLPLAAAGVNLAGKASGLLGKSVAGGALGATGGAIEGAVSGYGAGTDAESRKSSAIERGAVGGGFGGALGALAPIFGAGARAAYGRIKKMDVSLIADELGVDRKTARVIKGYIANDDLDAAAAKLAAIGDDAMLADAGVGTAQALDMAAASGGKALRVARGAVDDRANAAGVKLTAGLNRILGESKGTRQVATDIAKRTSAARQKAYSAAYNSPIDYASDAGRKIEEVLSRVPPKTLKAAIDEANEAMIVEGLTNKQVMASIADDGSVVFTNPPNVQQLDEIKKALGNLARSGDGVDNFNRLTAKGVRANKLASQLKDAMSEAVPKYSRAVKLGGDKIAEDAALDIGRKALSRATKVEDVAEVMRGASREAKVAAKAGLRENIADVMENVRRTISDDSLDAREAMQLVKDMSSKASQKKLRYILGQTDTMALTKELEQAEAALALRAALAQNSKTAARQSGQAALDEAIAPGLVGALMQGDIGNAGKQVVQLLTGATDAKSVALREKVAAQIAEALTQTRGPDAERALRLIRGAMDGQPIRDAEAAAVVRAVGSLGLAAGYQSGVQSLAR